MINIGTLTQIFAQKLTTTGSMDQALKKACWVAYKQGLADAKQTNTNLEITCNYPACNCPSDMGPDGKCLRGYKKTEVASGNLQMQIKNQKAA